eukprot:Lithocolla_globosa_v1_NODE_137_length_5828_cov_7.342228.p1 type:complete len:1315 gc:universal NODE_137_length_5828_cov_7.342228:1340-5284(+)
MPLGSLRASARFEVSNSSLTFDDEPSLRSENPGFPLSAKKQFGSLPDLTSDQPLDAEIEESSVHNSLSSPDLPGRKINSLRVDIPDKKFVPRARRWSIGTISLHDNGPVMSLKQYFKDAAEKEVVEDAPFLETTDLCSECALENSVVFCEDCKQMLCRECDKFFHSGNGRNSKHTRTQLKKKGGGRAMNRPNLSNTTYTQPVQEESELHEEEEAESQDVILNPLFNAKAGHHVVNHSVEETRKFSNPLFNHPSPTTVPSAPSVVPPTTAPSAVPPAPPAPAPPLLPDSTEEKPKMLIEYKWSVDDGEIGKKPGITVFILEKLKPKFVQFLPEDSDETVRLCEADAYILLKSSQVPYSANLGQVCFFWLGSHTQYDKKAGAAIYAVHLKNHVASNEGVLREEQGEESNEFCKAVPSKEYVDASQGTPSSLVNVASLKFPVKLMRLVPQGLRKVVLEKVELSLGSLKPQWVVFLLVYSISQPTIYVWCGSETSLNIKGKARFQSTTINSNDFSQRATVVVFDMAFPEQNEPEEYSAFLAHFPEDQAEPSQQEVTYQCGECNQRAAVVMCRECSEPMCHECDTHFHSGKGPHSRHVRTTLSKESSEEEAEKQPEGAVEPTLSSDASLFTVTVGDDDKIDIQQIETPAPWERNVLKKSACHIIENKRELFLWIGQEATKETRRAGTRVCQGFLRYTPNPQDVTYSQVAQNAETEIFKTYFLNWFEVIKVDHSLGMHLVKKGEEGEMAHIRVETDVLFSPPRPVLSHHESNSYQQQLTEKLSLLDAFVVSNDTQQVHKLPSDEIGTFYDENAYVYLLHFSKEEVVARRHRFFGGGVSKAGNVSDQYRTVVYFWQGVRSPNMILRTFRLKFEDFMVMVMMKSQVLKNAQIPDEVHELKQQQEPLEFMAAMRGIYVVNYGVRVINNQVGANATVVCDYCDVEAATLACVACDNRLCPTCDGVVHTKLQHNRVVLNVVISSAQQGRQGSSKTIDPNAPRLYNVRAGNMGFIGRSVQVPMLRESLILDDCALLVVPQREKMILWVGSRAPKETIKFATEIAGTVKRVYLTNGQQKDKSGLTSSPFVGYQNKVLKRSAEIERTDEGQETQNWWTYFPDDEQVSTSLTHSVSVVNRSKNRLKQPGFHTLRRRLQRGEAPHMPNQPWKNSSSDSVPPPMVSSQHPMLPRRFFRLSNVGGKFGISELLDFSQGYLRNTEIALVDPGRPPHVYLWFGLNAEGMLNMAARGAANLYVGQLKKRGIESSVMEIFPGREPRLFQACFLAWRKPEAAKEIGNAYLAKNRREWLGRVVDNPTPKQTIKWAEDP